MRADELTPRQREAMALMAEVPEDKSLYCDAWLCNVPDRERLNEILGMSESRMQRLLRWIHG